MTAITVVENTKIYVRETDNVPVLHARTPDTRIGPSSEEGLRELRQQVMNDHDAEITSLDNMMDRSLYISKIVEEVCRNRVVQNHTFYDDNGNIQIMMITVSPNGRQYILGAAVMDITYNLVSPETLVLPIGDANNYEAMMSAGFVRFGNIVINCSGRSNDISVEQQELFITGFKESGRVLSLINTAAMDILDVTKLLGQDDLSNTTLGLTDMLLGVNEEGPTYPANFAELPSAVDLDTRALKIGAGFAYITDLFIKSGENDFGVSTVLVKQGNDIYTPTMTDNVEALLDYQTRRPFTYRAGNWYIMADTSFSTEQVEKLKGFLDDWFSVPRPRITRATEYALLSDALNDIVSGECNCPACRAERAEQQSVTETTKPTIH